LEALVPKKSRRSSIPIDHIGDSLSSLAWKTDLPERIPGWSMQALHPGEYLDMLKIACFYHRKKVVLSLINMEICTKVEAEKFCTEINRELLLGLDVCY
jgi:hypothetical protein